VTGLEIIFEINVSFDVGLDLCAIFQIIHLLSFSKIIILFVKNDQKLKGIATLFTQIGFRIVAQKYDFQFISNCFSKLSMHIVLFKVPQFLYERNSNFMFLAF
jgi:hypothetical protein